MVVEGNLLASLSELCVRWVRRYRERAAANFRAISRQGSRGIPAVSPYTINAPHRRKLWATATRSITLVILASPRTVNWDTP